MGNLVLVGAHMESSDKYEVVFAASKYPFSSCPPLLLAQQGLMF